MKRLRLSIVLLLATVSVMAVTPSSKPVQAARNLVKRVLPEYYTSFEVEIASRDGDRDWFELEQKGDRIVLRGTNGVSVASALNYYLEHYTHSRIQWNSVNLHLTNPLPVVPERVHRETPYKYRYYFNYCTFNYSMSWWNWERWQREIDFMAMHGVNLPLALTGQNSIWQRVYRSMGFSDEELQSFFPGPAYFNWFWMGNLDGWGGPLPQSFMDGQERLQKQILQRERELGMMPILPAFTGHVPPTFKDKFPEAKLKKTHWLDIAETYILDPEDPLFEQIGTAFLKESIRTFGTNHFYSSDTFNENEPPQNDSTYLNGISQQIYNAMLAADSSAVWVMQGWLFTQSRAFWGESQTLALLNAVPDDRMIILDLWTEAHPVWQRKQAFYGKPWIWCMLNNFGGNNLMYGRMNEVAKGPYRTFCDSRSGHMQGIGLTPEAIETNPVIFEMMLDNVWRADSIEVQPWLHAYAHSRYGKVNDTIDAAWDILYRTVYSGGRGHGGPSASIIAARPTLQKDGRWTETTKTYQYEELLPAWSLLMSQAEVLVQSDGYRYDLVDVTRQVLANYADSLQRQIAHAYDIGDTEMFEDKQEQFLQVILDMDTLLHTRPEWRLSTWVDAARAWGTTRAEKDLYERNAKNLITTWGSRDCSIYDYSWRLWSGMLSSYYYERWKMYLEYVGQCMMMDVEMEQGVINEQVKDWEWCWVNSPSHSPSPSPYDEVTICKQLYTKYLVAEGD